jgi:hypothetical protein
MLSTQQVIVDSLQYAFEQRIDGNNTYNNFSEQDHLDWVVKSAEVYVDAAHLLSAVEREQVVDENSYAEAYKLLNKEYETIDCIENVTMLKILDFAHDHICNLLDSGYTHQDIGIDENELHDLVRLKREITLTLES